MMAENKMAQVAKLLGQELGKRFTVQYCNVKMSCIFFHGTFQVLDEYPFACYYIDEQVLYALITGGAEIIDDK